MSESRRNGQESRLLPATGSAMGNMKPGDFVLRSTQSRAAARLMLEQRNQSTDRLEVIFGCDYLPDHRPCATAWERGSDGPPTRVISIPEGMTVAEGLRILGGFTEGELEEVAARCPEPVSVGSLFEMRR